jgi:hypothetical protein
MLKIVLVLVLVLVIEFENQNGNKFLKPVADPLDWPAPRVANSKFLIW